MKNAINWFEIPVVDYDRAKKFYETIMDAPIADMPMPDMSYGVFTADTANGGIGGAIYKMKDANPSMDGSTIYLNGGEDLSVPLSKVETAGGKVLMPKTGIGENGFIAQFSDTEGNRVALHSMK